ncbi:MAG: GerAB/ArcD/ProY family transporter [Clostridia bacterium]|nr:GerAB/ArcD/ProY family transporter [Clostridia bacterium]
MIKALRAVFARGATDKNSELTFRKGAPAAKPQVNCRQLCFFAAFFLPVSKLLEAPSLLARYAAGDLLVPALMQYLLQTLALALLLFVLSRLDKPLLQAIADRFGQWTAKIICFLYAAYFLFSALLPLLDLEKFVYAAFYDTAPTSFTFAPFFLLSAYFCVKGLKALARSADLSLFLFLFPFIALMAMSVGQTDFTAVLPVFGEPFKGVLKGFSATAPHFADVALFLPLFCGYRYKKGDGKKIVASYWAGAAFVLFFLVVFLGLFTTLAPREHYAFIKVAQYFPALGTVGRLDLLFSYFLTVILFFYGCLPVLYTVEFFSAGINSDKRVLPSAVLNLALLVFVFYFNQRYNAVYKIFENAYPVFWAFSVVIPILSLFLLLKKPKMKKDGGRVETKEAKDA